jgi:hypothetical protein
MGRWAHAWAWTALWLLALGHATQAFPIGVAGALVKGLLLVPGVYLPIVLVRRETVVDLSGELSAPLAALVAGLFVTFLVLGFGSLFGYWDKRPRGATWGGVAGATLGLHLLAGACIVVAERFIWPEDGDDD